MGIFKRLFELIKKDRIIEKDVIGVSESENSVVAYLKEKLKPLFIEILADNSVNVFQLIENKKLLGYCWQSTQTCSIFLNNDDYIERGHLYIDEKHSKYYHSWICFCFNNQEYVFDPCLDCLCLKSIYYKRFKPEVIGKVSAKKVKEKFIDALDNQKIEDEKDSWLFQHLSEETRNKLKQEVYIDTKEDVNAPFYRGSVGYYPELKNGKIKKLIAHFYMEG